MMFEEILALLSKKELTEEEKKLVSRAVSVDIYNIIHRLEKIIPQMNATHIDYTLRGFEGIVKTLKRRKEKMKV